LGTNAEVIEVSLTESDPVADPDNCFGSGTLDLSRLSETPKALRGEVWGGVYLLPRLRGVWGSVASSHSGVWGAAPAANGLGHYKHTFVRFHACFSAFWNLTGKANKIDPIRPLLPAIGLEGARAPCHPVPPVWISPWSDRSK